MVLKEKGDDYDHNQFIPPKKRESSAAISSLRIEGALFITGTLERRDHEIMGIGLGNPRLFARAQKLCAWDSLKIPQRTSWSSEKGVGIN